MIAKRTEKKQIQGFVLSPRKGRKRGRKKRKATHILSRHSRPEGLVHISIDLGPHLGRQIAIRIVLVHVEREFCPDAQVDDTLIDTVRPVVVDDFDVIYSHPPTEQHPLETTGLPY